ncbi:MAG: dppF1 [Acidimicrobiaceae bacterium]|nr:dppF1 [Acidimicrobiaceae bacterium]
MTDSGRPILSVQDLVVYRGKGVHQGNSTVGKDALRVVEGVSFEAAAGETLGIVGESGCGKTTLVHAVLRLIPYQSGQVIFEDVDLGGVSERKLRSLRRDLQVVFQDPYSSLHPRKLIGKILSEPLELHTDLSAKARERAVISLLNDVGLGASFAQRFPRECSGGQRQRVAIARALALRPKLVILDEPVSALDVSIRAQIIELLAQLQRDRGLTYLFISHDLALMRSFCQRLAVMYLGRVVEYGPSDVILHRPSHPYTRSLLASMPIPDPEVERRRNRIEVRGEIPSIRTPPSGCTFHPRCNYAVDRCQVSEPMLEVSDAGVLSRCFFSSEVAAQPPLDDARSSDAPPEPVVEEHLFERS